jgi:hypothetical protein
MGWADGVGKRRSRLNSRRYVVDSRPPKAGVAGPNPAGRTIRINDLQELAASGAHPGLI